MSVSIKQVVAGGRLTACMNLWNDFFYTLSRNSRVCIVHHGDIDGLVAAAYAYERLLQVTADLTTRTVHASDYDFGFLPELFAEDHTHYVFLDVSIENHSQAVKWINALSHKTVFIFDHHLEREAELLNPGIFYANPTPRGNVDEGHPIPSFMFAMRLAQDCAMTFPDWLVAAALFIDGDDQFFPNDADTLTRAMGEADNPRERFRMSSLSNIGNYISADVYDNRDSLHTLRLFRDVACSKLISPQEFLSAIDESLGPSAKRIAQEKSHWVTAIARAAHRINRGNAPCCLITAVRAGHVVSGPVASIVRGKFPRDVVITYAVEDGKGLFELRTGNQTTMSLPHELAQVSESVDILNFGGHKPAAGASVSVANIAPLVEGLAKHFEQRGFEVFEYDEAENVFRRHL